MDQPRLLTPDQTAKLLGLSKRSLLAAAAEGIIPRVGIGRRVMFDREAIEEFIRTGGKRFEGGWCRKARAS